MFNPLELFKLRTPYGVAKEYRFSDGFLMYARVTDYTTVTSQISTAFQYNPESTYRLNLIMEDILKYSLHHVIESTRSLGSNSLLLHFREITLDHFFAISLGQELMSVMSWVLDEFTGFFMLLIGVFVIYFSLISNLEDGCVRDRGLTFEVLLPAVRNCAITFDVVLDALDNDPEGRVLDRFYASCCDFSSLVTTDTPLSTIVESIFLRDEVLLDKILMHPLWCLLLDVMEDSFQATLDFSFLNASSLIYFLAAFFLLSFLCNKFVLFLFVWYSYLNFHVWEQIYDQDAALPVFSAKKLDFHLKWGIPVEINEELNNRFSHTERAEGLSLREFANIVEDNDIQASAGLNESTYCLEQRALFFQIRRYLFIFLDYTYLCLAWCSDKIRARGEFSLDLTIKEYEKTGLGREISFSQWEDADLSWSSPWHISSIGYFCHPNFSRLPQEFWVDTHLLDISLFHLVCFDFFFFLTGFLESFFLFIYTWCITPFSTDLAILSSSSFLEISEFIYYLKRTLGHYRLIFWTLPAESYLYLLEPTRFFQTIARFSFCGNSTLFYFLILFSIFFVFSSLCWFFFFRLKFQISLSGLYTTLILISRIILDILIHTAGKLYLVGLLLLLFCFLVCFNLFGLVPYSFALTSYFSVTFFFSFIFFFLLFFVGIIKHGFAILNLFIPPGTPFVILPLLFLIEVISYFARIFSLAIRLFANITAGHILLYIFSWFITMLFDIFFFSFLGLCLVSILWILELFISVLQAYVFVVLLSLYINEILYLEH